MRKNLPLILSRRTFLKGSLTAASLMIVGCNRDQPPVPTATATSPPPSSATSTQPAASGATSTKPAASAATATATTAPAATPAQPATYANPALSFAERVRDLVSQMTLEEKVSQMGSESPAIERLGIPAYNWWNEALHGVARAGIATVFPQAIGLASTWNADLIYRMAEAISDEGRAKHHDAARKGWKGVYTGLTFWSPNINIFRDPRWGRGQETYGEDPYLTSRLGVNFVRGIQGTDPRYLKAVATPKHYAVHSGPEKDRHHFDARVSERDLRMTYLPAFEACIVEGQAASIMGAYNRVNGEASCASPTLLQEILRDEWGFEGYVVSDCGAIDDIYTRHRLVNTPAEAAALAVKNGCDLECGCTYNIACHYQRRLVEAVKKGLLTEDDLNRSLERLLMARFRLGMFDPDDQVPYAQIPYSVVDSPEHRELALEVARQSLVLLKNEDSLLPLDRDNLKSIAVIGPNADETLVLAGNYSGTPAEPVSVLAGIQALVSPETEVTYARGCEIVDASQSGFAEAVEAAKKSQVAVMVMGLSQQLEGEEGQTEGNPRGVRSRGDRETLDLPPVQEQLLQAVYETGTPIILVLINGSAVSINWAAGHVPAILEAWYPGQAGGTAVAEALFGLTNPGGRLPVTFYRAVSDLPAFDDYSMENRTYRYFTGQPLYAFGYGLSYTTFTYRNLEITPEQIKAGDPVSIKVEVENTGQRPGDEVVQLYLKDVEASLPVPLLQLQGFTRIRLSPGEKQTVEFTVTAAQMSFADEDGKWVLEPGEFQVWVGGQQPNPVASAQPANVLVGQFVVQD
ncbi:MAG TPA: glycoside hydrolase family 3 C-terminal domain-containing protein [Anaerolineae bacterium]|nr:glycoside hydrolase family 3 C-terminal domain-containing protein [Anaerolineae bacterium]HQI84134.1 glycoside hydrolase family 3 C-terminal domain-containing protein [Anaerolineae bacterium]